MLRLAWLMMLLAAPFQLCHAFVVSKKKPSRRAITHLHNVPCPILSLENEEDDAPSTTATAATATWKWCTQFVLAHNLCPWAAASLASASSVVRIYTQHQYDKIDQTVQTISTDLQDLLDKSNDPGIHSKAIFFLIFGEGRLDDFEDFYDIYCRLEDAFLETNESITLAPFHPRWQFEGDDNAIDYEKRSPVPTISFVSTRGIEQGGVGATAAIATANQKTFSTKSAMEWKAEWNRVVLGIE